MAAGEDGLNGLPRSKLFVGMMSYDASTAPGAGRSDRNHAARQRPPGSGGAPQGLVATLGPGVLAPSLFAFTATAPRPLPAGWRIVRLDGARALLEPGEEGRFLLRARPPLPEELPKPSALESVTVTAWMSHGDAFIPVMSLPFHYALSQGTRLTFSQTDPAKPTFNGRLRRIVDGVAQAGIGDQNILVTVSGSDGSVQNSGATTDETGNYTIDFEPSGSVSYALTARYAGSPESAAEAPPRVYQP